MKAWILHGAGDIRFEDTECVKPAPGYVKLKVKAAGICGSDIPRIYKTGAHRMPLIPGHEFSGIVEEAGEGVDPSLKGLRVGVYPLIPCRKCDACSRGLYELCRDYDYTGSRSDGAFAEYVNVPAANLIELPDEVSFEAAAMLEPMAVAVNAVRRGTEGFTLDKAAKVTVCGLGTIGIFVCMFLAGAGYANIYGIGNKPGQKERFTSLGIPEDHYIDSGSGSMDKTEGAALIFECVGKNETLALGIDLAGPAGRLVLVGNPYSSMSLEKDTYWKLLRKEMTVRGVWNSVFNGKDDDDWHYVISALKAGKVDPERFITQKFPLSELEKGFIIMRDKTEDYCKVMFS